MSNKKYRLLKDAPEVKAGEIYEPQPGNKNWYVSKSNSLYHAATIENNPEWFEEIKERLDGLAIDASKGSPEEWGKLIELWHKFKPTILLGDNKYTQSEVDKIMEDAFNAGRELATPYFGSGVFYKNFNAYKNHKS